VARFVSPEAAGSARKPASPWIMVASLQNRFGISHVVGFVSLTSVGSARKPASPWIIGRFAPNRFGISHVVGFVSLDAVGSHPDQAQKRRMSGTPGLGAQAASPWIIGRFQEIQAEAKMLELKTPGPARRNPANPARSGRKQR
jgi:hypothetical protein